MLSNILARTLLKINFYVFYDCTSNHPNFYCRKGKRNTHGAALMELCMRHMYYVGL